MPRPHEDLENHTLVDHRSGGPAVAFAAGSWVAVVVARVAAHRADAAVSAYETLIERARTSSANARASVVLLSANRRRVVALVGLDGHDAFRHLAAEWDDRHLRESHHDVAESATLELYRVRASLGIALIDASSPDAWTVEHVALAPERFDALAAPVERAPGFRGTYVFGSDDGTHGFVLYRFEHRADLVTFRATQPAIDVLGAEGDGDDTLYGAHPAKTFA